MTAWADYEPARRGGGWLRIGETHDGLTIEALALADSAQPVTVAHVRYGPRGGAQIVRSGTVDSLEEEAARVLALRMVAQAMEALPR